MNGIENEKDLVQSHENIIATDETVEVVQAAHTEQKKTSVESIENVDASSEEQVETMQVMIHPLPASVRKNFEGMMSDLLVMQGEIEDKQRLAHEQNTIIGERITHLVKEYDIEINRSHYDHFVKSIATYMQLLHDIRREFAEEIVLCRYVADLEEPKLYDMPASADLESYKWFLGHDALTETERNNLVLAKIQQVKRHIKTVKKDLRVSFSRYLYGFDAQMKQVERIELSMQYMEMQKQRAEYAKKHAAEHEHHEHVESVESKEKNVEAQI